MDDFDWFQANSQWACTTRSPIVDVTTNTNSRDYRLSKCYLIPLPYQHQVNPSRFQGVFFCVIVIQISLIQPTCTSS